MKKLMTILSAVVLAVGTACAEAFTGTQRMSFDQLATGALDTLKNDSGTTDPASFYWATNSTGAEVGFVTNFQDGVITAYSYEAKGSSRPTYPGTSNVNFLDLDDTDETIYRAIKPRATDNDKLTEVDIGDAIYIDTVVQMTPTESIKVPTLEDNAKIAFWMGYDADNPSAGTNLYVTARGNGNNESVSATNYVVVATNSNGNVVQVNPNEWHRITIRAIERVSNVNDDKLSGFLVFIDGNPVISTNENYSTMINADLKDDLTSDAQIYFAKQQLFITTQASIEDENIQLTALGFKGNGKVDDISFTDVVYAPEFAKIIRKLTLSLDTGVTSVKYATGSVTNTIYAAADITLEGANRKVELLEIVYADKYQFDGIETSACTASDTTITLNAMVAEATIKALKQNFKVDNKYYETIGDAVAAIPQEGAGTIVLNDNISVDGVGDQLKVDDYRDVTLDLYGKTITCVNYSDKTYALLTKGRLTVIDSLGGGRVTIDGNDSAFAFLSEYTTFITGMKDGDRGVTYDCRLQRVDVKLVGDDPVEVEATNKIVRATLLGTKNSDELKFEFKGNIVDDSRLINNTENDGSKITGGYWVVKPQGTTWQIGEYKYDTLTEALVEAKDGDLITLLNNTTNTAAVTVTNAVAINLNNNVMTLAAVQYPFTVSADASITNGMIESALTANLAGSMAVLVAPEMEPTFKNVEINAAHYEYGICCDSNHTGDEASLASAYATDPTATVTCENVRITGNGTLFYAQWVNLNLVNCTAAYDDNGYFANDAHRTAVYSALNAKVTINGGNYTHANALQSGNLGAMITVTDGIFTGDIKSYMLKGKHTNLETNPKYQAKFYLNGGTYNNTIAFVESETETEDRAFDYFKKGASVALAAPTGYEWNKDNILVKKQPIAIISADGTSTNYYATIDAAIAALPTGGKISIVQNWTLPARIDVAAAEKNIVIDLGGNTIYPTVACLNHSAFNVQSGTVTITNGVIDATAIAESDGETDTITVRQGATVNLTADLTVKINTKNGACVYAFRDAYVNIYGGSYINETLEEYEWKTGIQGMPLNQWNYPGDEWGNKKQLIKVYGGFFRQYNPAKGDDSGSCTTFVADGYYSYPTTQEEEEGWTVSNEVPAAKIGDINYLTLADAITAAEAGQTVTLCKDISTAAAQQWTISKNITIDFAGYTITKTVANDWVFTIANGATVVFKDSTGNVGGITHYPTQNNQVNPASMIQNKGNLTILSGKYQSDFCVIKNDEDPGAGVLTVEGGIFTVAGAHENYEGMQWALMNWATATIKGGTWTGVIGTRSADRNNVSKFGTTEIAGTLAGKHSYFLYVGDPKDTTFTNFPKIKGVEKSAIDFDQVAACTDELALVADGDYVTVASVVAKIGDEYYKSFAAAIAAVKDGDVITILKDITDAVGMSINVGKDFAVNFNGHTYTVNKPGAGSPGTTTLAFQIYPEQTIVFSNGTINASKDNLTPATGDSKNIKRFFQSYGNLELKDMTLDGTNLYTADENQDRAVIETAYGSLQITGSTSITCPSSGEVSSINVDTWKIAAYKSGTTVTIDTTGNVGRIYCYSEGTETVGVVNSSLALNHGQNVSLKIQGTGLETTIQNNMGDQVAAPAGYKWGSDGKLVVADNVAIVISADGLTTNSYWNLNTALTEAKANEKVELIANVDLENKNWTPVANFAATFDGKDHTISNLKVEQTTNYAGLFAQLAGNAVIKNVNIVNVDVTGKQFVSAVAADMSAADSMITNVNVSGNISIVAEKYAAAITAWLHGKVLDCHVNGGDADNSKISAMKEGKAGGVVCYVDTASGYDSKTRIVGCSVAKVTVMGKEAVGAILSRLQYSSVIADCSATDVKVKCDESQKEIGGIIGGVYGRTDQVPSYILNTTATGVTLETTNGVSIAYKNYSSDYESNNMSVIEGEDVEASYVSTLLGNITAGTFTLREGPTATVGFTLKQLADRCAKGYAPILNQETGKYVITPVFGITITAPENGTLETSVTNGIPAGTTINVTATADEHYELDTITTNGSAIVGTSFVMPAENVTVAATFKKLKYDITWKYDADTVVDVTKVEYDDMPTHTNFLKVGYTQQTWTPDIVKATGAATYTAVFTANVYKVTFSTNTVVIAEKTLYKTNNYELVAADVPTAAPFTGGSWVVDPNGAVITCDTNFNYSITSGPQIDPGTGSDPTKVPTITGKDGEYQVELKSGDTETTAVKIDGLKNTDVVTVPSQITTVNGVTAPSQLKVKTSKSVDITAVVSITVSDSTATIGDLIEKDNTGAYTTVEVTTSAGKETVRVNPEIKQVTVDDEVVAPFDGKKTVGLKTIPGLTYQLVGYDEIGGSETAASDATVADETNMKLENTKFTPSGSKAFFRVKVTK